MGPRVVGDAIGGGFGGGYQPELAHRGAAKHGEPDVEEPLRERVGVLRQVVPEQPRPVGHGVAFELQLVLEQERHPVKGPSGGRGGRYVEAVGHEMQGFVGGFEPGGGLFGQLGRACLAGAHELCETHGVVSSVLHCSVLQCEAASHSKHRLRRRARQAKR